MTREELKAHCKKEIENCEIELVIKINEDVYKARQHWITNPKRMVDEIDIAIANGTLLPKEHGRIGDLDALREEVSSWGMNDYEPSDFIDEIDRADTIIEANKAESEKRNDYHF